MEYTGIDNAKFVTALRSMNYGASRNDGLLGAARRTRLVRPVLGPFVWAYLALRMQDTSK